ncbi:MAG: LysR family transcriptional regulator [Pseudomonadota bacterium]
MDWEDLKSFVTVAELGTVRRAADQLGVHHATVGRRIARLEEATGTRLFDRRPEGLVLTSPGEELLTVASRAASDFDAAHRRIAGQDAVPTGQVTASMGEPVANHIIAPGLPGFAAQYPGLSLHINATWAIQDLARGDADVAIRADNNPSDTLFGKRLFAYRESVYASPDYLRTYSDRSIGDSGRWIGWGGRPPFRPAWVESSAFSDTQVWGGFHSLSLQVAAAEAGLGFVALPCLVGDNAAGLVRADTTPPRPARDIWVLTHADLRRTKRVRVTMEFLEDQLRQHRAIIEGNA